MASLQEVSAMRVPYHAEDTSLSEADLVSKEPFKNFEHWFKEAVASKGEMEANSMAVATADRNGRPSVRMILLKGFDETGFKFFTNYDSRKGRELAENPFVSLMFYWESLKKMVRVEGRVEKLPVAESTQYFHERPRSSQISATVSEQSSLVRDREKLISLHKQLSEKYSDTSIEIPKPDSWGGYLVKPTSVEFWQGQTTRLHDRIIFRRPQPEESIDTEITHQGDDGWVYERLCP